MAKDDSRFVIAKSANDQYYFFLRARNGEKLVTSETYPSRQSAQEGIDAVRDVTPNAPVIDMTR